MNIAFTNNIRRARKIKGLTQEQAASLLGIKRPTLGAYEEGRAEPSCRVLAKIFDVYEIDNAIEFLTSTYDFTATSKKRKISKTEKKLAHIKKEADSISKRLKQLAQ